jgi:hypothetical protein
MDVCIDENRLKELMKQAFVEVLEDRRETIYEILSDVIEDMALGHVIEEGQATETVSKDVIFDVLEDRA